jgi:hypothetical protein
MALPSSRGSRHLSICRSNLPKTHFLTFFLSGPWICEDIRPYSSSNSRNVVPTSDRLKACGRQRCEYSTDFVLCARRTLTNLQKRERFTTWRMSSARWSWQRADLRSGMADLTTHARGVRRRIDKWVLATNAGAWLCVLPLLLRRHSLPALLAKMDTREKRTKCKGTPDLNATVSTLSHVCRLRFFRPPLFPRACLRQSLVLYRFLSRMGYPVEIQFGIRKDGPALEGHSWVTLSGVPLGERGPVTFTVVYSYPQSEPSLGTSHGKTSHGSWTNRF